MKKDISDTLRIGSLISTVLVVAAHYISIAAIPTEKGLTFNFYIQEFILGGLARFVIPYFALLSGFFSLEKGKGWTVYKDLLMKKGRTLLLPYIVASYFIFLSTSYLARWINDPGALSQSEILSCLRGLLAQPSVQLWYLRDLLVLTLSVPILLYTPYRVRVFLSLLFGILWLGEIQPFPIFKGWYLVSIETLFFFTLGGTLRETDLRGMRKYLNEKALALAGCLWSVLTVTRIIIKPDFFIWYSDEYTWFTLIIYKIAILMGIVMLILFSYQFREKKSLLYLSGFNFFVYLYHFYPLFYFRRITERFIPREYAFYLDFILAVAITYGAAWLFYRFFPRTNRVVTGERMPRKEAA